MTVRHKYKDKGYTLILVEEKDEKSPVYKCIPGDFLGGPVVKNLPSNAEDMSLIPGQGTRPHMLQIN